MWFRRSSSLQGGPHLKRSGFKDLCKRWKMPQQVKLEGKSLHVANVEKRDSVAIVVTHNKR